METVTFEKILFDMQLDIYNSVRIKFDSMFTCREFSIKLYDPKYSNILHNGEPNTEFNTYILGLYNFHSKKFNHADYDYIGDNNFKLRRIECGNSDI